jgi:hypothetical protein
MKTADFVVTKRPCLSAIKRFPTVDFADYERCLGAMQETLQLVQQAYLGTSHRAVIVLEGWDTAGKGGVVRRLGWALDPQESHWLKHPHAAKPGYTPLERYVKGQTAMENCLQKAPDINVVYTINEPAAAGAYQALKAAGKEKGVLIVSVDGGCEGVRNVQAGVIGATSQQYPLKMAQLGVDAGVAYAKTGKKVSGYTDTGVTLITDKPMKGVDSKDVKFGLGACWG